MIIFFYLLQTADDIQKVISTDNATVQGLLLGGCVIFAFTTGWLYRENKNMNKERIAELKEFNATILKINKSYDDFITNFEKYRIQKDVR